VDGRLEAEEADARAVCAKGRDRSTRQMAQGKDSSLRDTPKLAVTYQVNLLDYMRQHTTRFSSRIAKEQMCV